MIREPHLRALGAAKASLKGKFTRKSNSYHNCGFCALQRFPVQWHVYSDRKKKLQIPSDGEPLRRKKSPTLGDNGQGQFGDIKVDITRLQKSYKPHKHTCRAPPFSSFVYTQG